MNAILVALDDSERAALVRDTAVALARSLGGRLHVVRAVPLPVEVPPEAFEVSPNDLVGVLEERARADVTARLQGLPPELVASIDIRVGTPWEVICRMAGEHRVDLVVVGSHGYSAIERLLGTTAAKVVNHTDRSVLVVRSTPADPAAT